MKALKPYRIFPLGDSAITLDFGNFIDEDVNEQIISLFKSLFYDPLPGVRDLIPAYSSLTVFYDPFALNHQQDHGKKPREWIASKLEERLLGNNVVTTSQTSTFSIPVCYDKKFALDMDEVTEAKGLTTDQVIQIHSSANYHIYMLGFLPGFAYMGKLDNQLEMPRKLQPRQRVEPGSVGITGLQTAVYPLSSPGGWQIIGRTPVRLFRPEEKDIDVCMMRPGDQVKFFPISRDEFESY